MEVKLSLCKDFACSRGNHFACPRVDICAEVLHIHIFVDKEEVQDDTLYLVDIARCADTSCFSSEHLKCPQCTLEMHVLSVKDTRLITTK